MRTFLFIFSLLILSIVFQACQEDEDIVEEPESSLPISEEPAYKAIELDPKDPVVVTLVEMGYQLENITELRDYFLIGDLLFSKDINDYDADDKHGKQHHRHAHTNNLVTAANQIISIYIDPSMPTLGTDNWRPATADAVNDWNGVSGMRFYLTSSPFFADIVVKSDANQLPNGTIAAAGFPTSGQPYHTVLVNLNFLSNLNVSEGQKRYNMVHEIGHCIGFRHTNWDAQGEPVNPWGANLIPNTPAQDPASVMNGGTALNSWIGFSNFDLIASEFLYPVLDNNTICCNQTINHNQTPSTLVGSTPVGGNGSYTYRWHSRTFQNGSYSAWVSTPVMTKNFSFASPFTGGSSVYIQEYRRVATSNAKSITSSVASITVNPNPTAITNNVVTTSSSGSGILSGSAPSGGSGGYTYQWYYTQECPGNPSWGNAYGQPIFGATSQNYTVPSSWVSNSPCMQTTFFYRLVRDSQGTTSFSNGLNIFGGDADDYF